jgi:hypothetical protein
MLETVRSSPFGILKEEASHESCSSTAVSLSSLPRRCILAYSVDCSESIGQNSICIEKSGEKNATLISFSRSKRFDWKDYLTASAVRETRVHNTQEMSPLNAPHSGHILLFARHSLGIFGRPSDSENTKEIELASRVRQFGFAIFQYLPTSSTTYLRNLSL